MKLSRRLRIQMAIVASVLVLFSGASTNIQAAGLDDLANELAQKNKQVEELNRNEIQDSRLKRKREQDAILGIGVEPYSNDEILLILVLNSFADYSNFDKGFRPWTTDADIKKKEILSKSLGIGFVDEQRLTAFNNKYFGLNKCENIFQPFVYPFDERIVRPSLRSGLDATSTAVKYVIQKDLNKTDEMNQSIKALVNIFKDLKIDYENSNRYKGDCSQQIFDRNIKNLKEMVDFILKNEKVVVDKYRKAEADYAAYLAKVSSDQAADEAKANLSRERELACARSDKFTVYKLSKDIVAENIAIAINEKIIKDENKAAAISGLVDKNKLYEAGKNISVMSDGANRMFVKYKNAGGTASNYKSVKIMENPCLRQ